MEKSMNILHIVIQALIALVIWTSPALAGPAVGAIVASFAKKFIINLIVSAIASKIFGKKKGKLGGGGAGAQASVLVNKQSNNEFIPVVYGRRRLGGTRAFVGTSDGSGGSGTGTLNMVIALCEGQMGPVKQVFFNDTKIFEGTLNHEDQITNSNDIADTKYDGHCTIEYKDGREGQTVSSLMTGSIGSAWTGSHTLKGVAYLAVKLPFDADAYEGGVPTVTAVMDGKVIRSVANLSTTTSGADQNPADVIFDYLTDVEYGKGLADSDLNLASFQAARTYCASRYQINGVLDTENTLMENTENLIQSCNGMLIFHNGEYKLKIKGNEDAATRTFDQDNILSDVTVSLADIKSRLNKITLNFANDDATINYNDDVVIRDNATYKTQDAGRRLEAQLDMPLITDKTLIENIGDYLMDSTRDAMTIEFDAAHTEFGLEAGEVIKVTLADYGFTNKQFRVVQTELTTDNKLNVIAQEYTQSIHI